jgi:hypothetical protein
MEGIIMNRAYIFMLFFLMAAFPTLALAAEYDDEGQGWAVDVKAGTLGIGADVSRSIVPSLLNLRVGASFLSFSKDNIESDNINYDTKLKLGAVPIVADVFPFKNWFRIGGGLVVNLTSLEGTGRPQNGFINIGDNQYPAESVGELKAKLKINRAVPYLGVGFNNPIKTSGHMGFFVDLGFLYHGTPTIELTSTQTFPALQEDLNKQVQKTNDTIKNYSFFPVLQFGLSYKF